MMLAMQLQEKVRRPLTRRSGCDAGEPEPSGRDEKDISDHFICIKYDGEVYTDGKKEDAEPQLNPDAAKQAANGFIGGRFARRSMVTLTKRTMISAISAKMPQQMAAIV